MKGCNRKILEGCSLFEELPSGKPHEELKLLFFTVRPGVISPLRDYLPMCGYLSVVPTWGQALLASSGQSPGVRVSTSLYSGLCFAAEDYPAPCVHSHSEEGGPGVSFHSSLLVFEVALRKCPREPGGSGGC